MRTVKELIEILQKQDPDATLGSNHGTTAIFVDVGGRYKKIFEFKRKKVIFREQIGC